MVSKDQLDPWQKEVLEYRGDIAIRASRQGGKSQVCAIKAGEFAVHNPMSETMVVSSTEKQAYLLFEKILRYLEDFHSRQIKRGKERPTKHLVTLINGSKVRCEALGFMGDSVRGHTLDLLIIDECAFIDDNVFASLRPSLSIKNGKMILISTPKGNQGFFYRAFQEGSGFKIWHIPWQMCPRYADGFINTEKKRLTMLQFEQEYNANFVDKLMQFFPDEIIDTAMIRRIDSPIPSGWKYCGVDVARLGGDETVILTLVRKKERAYMADMEISEKWLITDTIRKIKEHDSRHNYEKIYIDDGGLGVGVFDTLLEDDQTSLKVVAINNARRSLDRDEKSRKKLMKEDIYTNLRRLMEAGAIELWREPEIRLSLRSVQYEYINGELRLFGNYTHIAEALARAAYGMKDPSQDLWAVWT